MMARETVFVSHETYTPARGGSASAEISALRRVFGTDADRIVIANTKGFTGHPMGVGLEDVVAVKALETGIVPPLANFKEPDPELGPLNLSTGGAYPVQFALRLAAGFGSQVSMMLLRWTPMPDGCHRSPDELGYRYRIEDQDRFDDWLRRISGDATARLEVSQRRLRIAQAQPAEATPTVVATPSPGLAEAPAGALAAVPLSQPATATTATPRRQARRGRQSTRPGSWPPSPTSRRTRRRHRTPWPSASWPWWPNRPATRPRCWPWTSTSKPTSASTPSSKRSCSRPSARNTGSSATTR